MPPTANLTATLAACFGAALLFGFIATKLRIPPLVGYLVAGIALGPATPGFVADFHLTGQLAEVGVMLLMFGVGLHFSLDDLLSVKRIAVPGALLQILVATAMGAVVASLWGWGLGSALVFGLSVSCASTIVLIRALEARRVLESINGKIAVGWLLVEDLVMVLVLVLLPAFAGMLSTEASVGAAMTDMSLWKTLGVTLAKILGFIVLMLVIGRRLFPILLWHLARTGSRELFTLCVVATAVGVAYGSAKLFGVSFALGAFFAGMMMRESEFSHRAADQLLPLRDAFSVLFFVSVGMLFDPNILIDSPMQVLAVAAIIMVGNPLVAMAVVLVYRYPLNTALTVGAGMAQIGEFSFILASMSVSLGLLSLDGQNLVLAGALISIALNSLVLYGVEPALVWIREKSPRARQMDMRDDPLAALPMTVEEKFLSGQVVLIGYGRVGRRIGEALLARNIPFVVAEQNREIVEQLRAKNIPAVSGDATDPVVMVQAHIARAGMLVIATPDTFNVRKIIEIARTLNPQVEVVLRTHSDEEAELLESEQVGKVFMAEHMLAISMTRHILGRMGIDDSGSQA